MHLICAGSVLSPKALLMLICACNTIDLPIIDIKYSVAHKVLFVADRLLHEKPKSKALLISRFPLTDTQIAGTQEIASVSVNK